MKKFSFKTFIALGLTLAALPPAESAEPTYECASERYGRVDHIHYNTDEYFATFTIEGHPDQWMALSRSKGLNTPGGRLMTAMIFSAYTAGINVNLRYCDENGYVDRVVLEDLN
jgi:hypothetical protein